MNVGTGSFIGDDLLEVLLENPSRAETLLSPAAFELVNRAVYQQSVATEQSPPSFKSVASHPRCK